VDITFDLDLIKKYDKSGPRYTSYPTAVAFHSDFTEKEYKKHALKSHDASGNSKPLSLYFHIPFCDTICFYCACNKIATKDYSKSKTYLEYLFREMEMQSVLFDSNRVVEQLHWGGGTPTFLNNSEIQQLMAKTRQLFNLLDDDSGDYSIEIDPRSVSADTIKTLRTVGFNRFSLGVQDIDPKVQIAVNRIQPFEETAQIVAACRDNNARSISLDLIYGLPMQSIDGYNKTLEKTIELSPDRLSLFNYAHMPHMFKPQRRINENDLPSSQDKLTILHNSIEILRDAGYEYIGMDHFAKPDDSLAIAQQHSSLHRNFQGYTTHADCDLVAFGVSAISSVEHSYSQNKKELNAYYADLDAGHLPIDRGLSMNEDDIIRKWVIQELSCQFKLDFDHFEKEQKLVFADYFKTELEQLKFFVNDGLLTLQDKAIIINPPGRLLIRNICMTFDVYMPQQNTEKRFSKVI